MRCKSCNKTIKPSFDYCPYCGGRIVTHRLGMKGTWREFVAPFFNWDNHFKKTLKDLLLRPHEVVEAFIQGANRRYFHPFSLLMIYTTLALIVSKIIPTVIETNVLDVQLDENTVNNADSLEVLSLEAYNKITYFFKNYYNIILILGIPISALINRLTFRKQRHNYAEHLIIRSYFNSFIGLILLLIEMVTYAIWQVHFSYGFLLSFLFFNYSFSRLYHLKVSRMIGVNIRYGLYNLLVYTILGVFMLIFMLIYAGIQLN